MPHRKKGDPDCSVLPDNKVTENAEGPQEESEKENHKAEKYSFLQETIKPTTPKKDRFFRRSARLALYGAILGIFACIGFFALKPWAERIFRGDPRTVTIPEDQEPTEEEEAEQEKQTKEEEQKLDAMSHDDMLASIYELADEAKKCIAAVSINTDSTEPSEKTAEDGEAVTGIITADNGQELLIFAPDSVCSGAQQWKVTFSDGSEYNALLKMRDKNRHLAVFYVPQREISKPTWEAVKVAVLGNSNLSKQGDMVIALGSMFSHADGISYGLISSTDYKETFYDGECDVIATDISAAKEGSGVLFNLDGEVVGLALSSIWKDEDATANAYAISDLKPVIELLANGENVPYIGVYGTTVTSSLKEEQGMPEGIYVIDVDPDSPAMAAGIQSGDIICEIDGEKVSSLVGYQKAALQTADGRQIRIKGMRLGADGYVNVNYTVTVGHK